MDITFLRWNIFDSNRTRVTITVRIINILSNPRYLSELLQWRVPKNNAGYNDNKLWFNWMSISFNELNAEWKLPKHDDSMRITSHSQFIHFAALYWSHLAS